MIELDNLTVGYGSRRLVEHACCSMPAGRLVALIGRNGTGKSTLLRVLAGLAPPLAGRVKVDGTDLGAVTAARRARLLAFVTTERIRVAGLRCRDVVAMGRAPYTDWIGRLGPADEEAVGRALTDVGLEGCASRPLDKMSDGECQRAMVARALAQDTPALLLDEPTSFLDLPNRYELCLLLRRLAHEKGKCVVFSTHELDIALSLCDDMALIDPPRLLFGTPAAMVEQGALQRLFRSPNMEFDPVTLTIRSKSNG